MLVTAFSTAVLGYGTGPNLSRCLIRQLTPETASHPARAIVERRGAGVISTDGAHPWRVPGASGTARMRRRSTDTVRTLRPGYAQGRAFPTAAMVMKGHVRQRQDDDEVSAPATHGRRQ